MAENGPTMGLVLGVGGLIVLVITTLVIIDTLIGSGLFEDQTIPVLNEYGWLNYSGYSLYTYNTDIRRGYAITSMVNTSDVTQVIPAANYSLSGGNLTNSTLTPYLNVTFNYTYNTANTYEEPAEGLSGNLTGGIDNISEKIPTILLIAAVVLLFGVLVLLIARSKQMGVGGGGSL